MNKNKSGNLLLPSVLMVLTIISCSVLGKTHIKQNSQVVKFQANKQIFPQDKLTSSVKPKITESTLVLLEEYKTYSDFLDLDEKLAVKVIIDEKPTIKQIKTLGRCEIYKATVNFYDLKKKNKIVKQIINSEYSQIYCKKTTHPSFVIPEPIQYSPNGKTLALKISSGAIDDYIHLYDVVSLKQKQNLSYNGFEDCCTTIRKQKLDDDLLYKYNTPIDFTTFSSDGKFFAAASEVIANKGSVRVWNTETGKMVFYAPFSQEYQKYEDNKFPLPFLFSVDKKYLHWFGGITWNIVTGEELNQEQTKTIFKNEMGCQLFNPNNLLGLKNKDGFMEVVDLTNGEVKFSFDSKLFFEKDEKVIRISQEGNILTTASQIQSAYSTTLPVKIRYWQIQQ
jgi:WD40 repeat protein